VDLGIGLARNTMVMDRGIASMLVRYMSEYCTSMEAIPPCRLETRVVVWL
jgi:hypothetical protein